MIYSEKVQLIAAQIFRHLPSRTSREAQSSHRTARAAAVSVMDELERISRMSALPASPSVPTEGHGAASVVLTKRLDVVTRADFGLPGDVGDAAFQSFAAQYPAESLFEGDDGVLFVVTRPGKARTGNAVGTKAQAEVNQTNQVNP